MGELESTVEEQRRTILEWQRAHGELQHGELQSSQPSAGGVDEDIINELLEQVAATGNLTSTTNLGNLLCRRSHGVPDAAHRGQRMLERAVAQG